jgi:hypothetical protein
LVIGKVIKFGKGVAKGFLRDLIVDLIVSRGATSKTENVVHEFRQSAESRGNGPIAVRENSRHRGRKWWIEFVVAGGQY